MSHDTRALPLLCALIASVLLLSACASETGRRATEGPAGAFIQPYTENPRYWQYAGDPVLLVGGTREDNLFQIPDLEAHLDRLAAAGGNYVRNTMSSRDEGDRWPFFQQAGGRYDLERPDEEYYDRFERLLRLAHERDIIVQIEVWDRFDYAREPWQDNPFRPANNVNYTTGESGLADEYPEHPGSNNNPFFRSVPDQNDNRLLLRYQQAHVDRILDRALQYPNVLYCMDNETSANPDWGAYWARYIKDRAAEAGVVVQTTEMWDAWDLKDEEHRRTLDRPGLYDFADVSQNNHNQDQEHWDNLQWVRDYTAEAPRPLNHVKIYGADGGPYGSTRDALERFWRSILGGAASVRFHRPSSGIGLSETAQTHIRSAGLLVNAFDFFRARPDTESRLLSDRGPDEAYLSYVPGEQYAVYFTDGGSVQLDLTDTNDSFTLQWLDIAAGSWQQEEKVTGGRALRLESPRGGHWVALLHR